MKTTALVWVIQTMRGETVKIGSEVFLWPNSAPGSAHLKIEEKVTERSANPAVKDRVITGITKPAMIPMFPNKPRVNGAAVLICPGGGYRQEVWDIEGTDIVTWLNSIGIAAFILKYRLPVEGHQDGPDVPLQDAQRAMRVIRRNAKEWGINPQKIGVMGFSAGGHLAATLGTQSDRKVYQPGDECDQLDCKPNFMVLMYPVISMQSELKHTGSRANLIGKRPRPELVEQFSNERHVSAATPPTFIALASDDSIVPTENSTLFYQTLKRAKVSCELHLFSKGGHGFGIRKATGSAALWIKLCETWLVSTGIIGK